MEPCVVCDLDAGLAELPPRERAYVSDEWRVSHAWSSFPGWLVVATRRHVTRLSELSAGEAAALGPLLAAASGALEDEVGCGKTYVMLFAEHPGFAHLHVHVVPRMPGLEDDRTGPRVLAHIAAPEEEWVPAGERDRLARAIGARIAGRPAD